MSARYFTKRTFAFLAALAENNDRLWFAEHRQEYEDEVRAPALAFIADMAAVLPSISPHFRAVPKKAGGSLMRVQRNLRFSRDKTPYKVNVGIQFRHELGRDVHAPGFYVHVEPGDCFVGAGLWRPEPEALLRIRLAIAGQGEAWTAAREHRNFHRQFVLSGEALANAPRGFATDHPLLADLKRKDFIGLARLTQAQVLSGEFLPLAAERFRAAGPLMRFLCEALTLRY